MCNKSFVKRIVPFFLTFAVGLFIASFFVTIAAPKFGLGFRRERLERHLADDRRMELEYQQLKEKNSQLEKQLADKDSASESSFEVDAVPAPPMPPMPPPAPVKNFRK